MPGGRGPPAAHQPQVISASGADQHLESRRGELLRESPVAKLVGPNAIDGRAQKSLRDPTLDGRRRPIPLLGQQLAGAAHQALKLTTLVGQGLGGRRGSPS